jgi:tetratricopeptide (TPR) repeat protein
MSINKLRYTGGAGPCAWLHKTNENDTADTTFLCIFCGYKNMGQLLQILGRGIEVETADLIWHWLGEVADARNKSDPRHAQQLRKIIESASEKRPAALQRTLDEYRVLHPRCYYADLAAAAAALTDNRLNDAVSLLKAVYSRCPRNVTALYALGHCCERLGREADAVAYYQDCLKFKNYLRLPRQRLAAIHFKNGQIEQTIGQYQQLTVEYPDDLSTLNTLGYLYIAAGQYKTAVDTFSTAILIQPDNFCPDTDPIDSLIEAGELTIALGQIEMSLDEFPDRPDLVLRRASVLAGLGEQEQALDYYNHAVNVCPSFLEANIKLGSHYLRLGKPASAALQFARAANVNDLIVDAYLGMATAQKLAGCTSESLVSLALASAVEMNGPLLLAETARLQYHPHLDDSLEPPSQDLTPILNAHSQLLKQHPHNPELHYRFGALLMSIGRLTQAIELFTRAIELNPTFSLARNKLAVCLHETDESALALETIASSSRLNPDMTGIYHRIAILYCDKIKFASSLLNLEQWLNDSLASADAVVNISVVLQNLGLIDPAVSTCESFAQLTAQPASVQ